MSWRSDQRKLPSGLLAAFVAVVLLPSAMLVTLGIRLLDQDRALEDRRRHELADAALERAAAAFQKEIANLHHTATLGPFLYLPSPPILPEPPAEPFAEADRLEFQSPDPAQALALNTRLASNPSNAIQAGALLRIARLHRKAGRIDDALAAWSRLLNITGIAIAGEPAGLMARRARARALQAAGRKQELAKEAELLQADLHAGRWPIDRETFLQVSQQAPPKASLARAEALSHLWPKRNSPEGVLCHENFTLIWNANNAVLTANSFPLPPGVQLTCAASAPRLTAVPNQQPLPEFSARRTALLSALFTLFILITAAAYFAWRAITRELGVARLQSDFVAAVSHEFRTPLTSLRQFNEMLLDEPNLPADARLSYYKAQARATGRLSRLVETLLDFGRMEAGRRPYNLEPLDAAALVRAIAEEFRNEPAARGFEIQCQIPPHALPVHADHDALWRAIWNLLDNAVKYSGDRRDILIQAAQSGTGVTVKVVDHGIGIPSHEQPRLFQKFVRGEGTRRSGIPGTGIGLAMVRHIAEAHGGSVALESVEGQGSTFSLMLPGRT